MHKIAPSGEYACTLPAVTQDKTVAICIWIWGMPFPPWAPFLSNLNPSCTLIPGRVRPQLAGSQPWHMDLLPGIVTRARY